MQEIKELISSLGHATPVVAKIEKFEAIDQIDSILPCDGVMVARGDLGVEMAAEEVPCCKRVDPQGQLHGHPDHHGNPDARQHGGQCPADRAEVSDVANAILDGTDAVMLSNETAVGDYAVEAVETMDSIARRIEKDYPNRQPDTQLTCTIPNAISMAVSTIATQLDAAAILTLTKRRHGPHREQIRPSTPILAITSDVKVARQLQLVWGVNPGIATQASTSRTFSLAMGVAQEQKLLQDGDLVIQTAGTLLVSVGPRTGESRHRLCRAGPRHRIR